MIGETRDSGGKDSPDVRNFLISVSAGDHLILDARSVFISLCLLEA